MSNTENQPKKKLSSADFAVGMRVRVPDELIGSFMSGFGNKIKNREGLVVWVSKYSSREEAREDKFYSSHVNKVQVKFLKRNGRGKEFTEMMFPNDLEILAGPEEQTEPSAAAE